MQQTPTQNFLTEFEFKPLEDIFYYKVCALKKNIYYSFKTLVEILNNGKYLSITSIGQQDYDLLNNLFRRMNPKVYISMTNIDIPDPLKWRKQKTFKPGKLWIAEVKIFGYKFDENFKYSPSWAMNYIGKKPTIGYPAYTDDCMFITTKAGVTCHERPRIKSHIDEEEMQ